MTKYSDFLSRTEDKPIRFAKLERLLASPEIIADNRYWRRLLLEKESLAAFIKTRSALVSVLSEYERCKDDLYRETDEELKKMLAEECTRLCSQADDLFSASSALFLALGENCDCDLELIPDGNKSQDFCETLLSMYQRFLDSSGYSYTQERMTNCIILHITSGYARIKTETGLHKSGLLSVAVTAFPVTEKKPLSIGEKDLRIDLFHSGGAGGQNINKVETAIRITHLPTGIVVTCQDERSQLQNKNKAMETLQKKLLALQAKEETQKKEELRKKSALLLRTYDFTNKVATQNKKKYPLDAVLNGELPQ